MRFDRHRRAQPFRLDALQGAMVLPLLSGAVRPLQMSLTPPLSSPRRRPGSRRWHGVARRLDAGLRRHDRSEEHTSELQSLMRISYAVFCLKKKTQHKSYSDRARNEYNPND